MSRNIYPVEQLFYKIESADVRASPTVAGTNTLLIRPPAGEVWLMDRITVHQSDTLKRTFSVGLVAGSILIPIYAEGHVIIANGGVAAEQTLFPVWHDVSGGIEQDHYGGLEPLQLDHNNYVQIRGLAFAINKEIIVKYQYRRVI